MIQRCSAGPPIHGAETGFISRLIEKDYFAARSFCTPLLECYNTDI